MKTKLLTRAGNPAQNQTVTTYYTGDKLFTSYTTKIAYVQADGNTTLDHKWDYSKTTLEYTKRFLGLEDATKADIQTLIDSGSIKLTQLN